MQKLFTPSACDLSFNFHRDYKRLSKTIPKPSCLSISEMTVFKGPVPRFQAFASISERQPLMQYIGRKRPKESLSDLKRSTPWAYSSPSLYFYACHIFLSS